MYAAPIDLHTILTLGYCVNIVAKPMLAAIITTLRPIKIPAKKGVPFFIPNAAPVAARANGAGPGEPSKIAAVLISTINESSN